MKTILLLLFTLTASVACSQPPAQSLIYWNRERPLRWSDFLGRVPFSGYGKTAALSAVEIKTSARWFRGKPDYKVYVAFQKDNSWTRNDTSELLLKHEQLHFDIGELYARKMRKKLKALRSAGNTNSHAYLRALKRLEAQWNKAELQYDRETAHGVDRIKQEKWNRKVAKALCQLRSYSVSP